MKELTQTSPMRLAGWVGAGSLLWASAFLLGFTHAPCKPIGFCGEGAALWGGRLLVFLGLACLLGGFALVFWAERKLKLGMKEGVWSEAELEPLRRRLDHPVWGWLGVVGMIGVVAVLVLYARGSVHLPLFYLLLFPFQNFNRVKQIVKRAQNEGVGAGALRDWRSFRPIRSEHWGEATGTGERL
ncbi:hypothetical protein [Granulicella sp. L60]|uniref:hypothetical protein n=1 Tax=Granulicella sp. L60 TaxID=1641866 RepID=UPI00131D98A4|nr:hypothetical protein [Granulicella sp. L60]